MNLVDRVKNIIVSPKTEWEVIAEETPDAGGIFMGYVLPLAAVAAIATFIGTGFIGIMGFASTTLGIVQGIVSLISTTVAVFATAFIVDALAGSFGSEKNFGRALQLVAYGYTPAWLGGILAIFPPIAMIGSLFGLYGIYLMYLGFPHMMKTPKDKVVVYMIVTFVILMIVYFVLLSVLTAILFSVFGLSLLSMM